MENKVIAENYKRFFGEELNEADALSKQGQDMSGGPIQQNDPAADPVGSFKPDAGAKDEQPEEGGEDEGKDSGELKDQIFDLLKEGEVPEAIIIKFFSKDDKSEGEVKKALEELKNDNKIQDRTIWSIVATDEEEDKTGISKKSTEDETEEEPEEKPAGAGAPPAPEAAGMPGGASPAGAAPGPATGGGMPPMAMKNNYKKNEDDDFLDDEFDSFDDEDEDEDKFTPEEMPLKKEKDEEEDDNDDDKVVDEIIDDVDDLKVLLKSIEPRLRKLREKSASAKKAVK